MGSAERKPTDVDGLKLTDEQARQWMTKLHGGGITALDRERFEAWLKAAPEHPSAYRRAEQIWRDLSLLDTLANVDIERRTFLQRWRSHPLLASAASLLIAVAAGILCQHSLEKRYETRVAEVRELTLPDGTRVSLGGHSALRVNFNSASRNVVLKSGEAFFSVTKDPSRPFYVSAGDTKVRVLGTQFDVHKGTREIRVAVTEGTVEVAEDLSPSSKGATVEKHLLTAGQELVESKTADDDSPTLIRGIKPDQPGAWRRGRLSYENASLSEIIDDVNRYSQHQIVLADPSLRELRVTMAFRTDQIDEMLSGLAATHPIVIDSGRDGRMVLRSRH